MVAIDPRACVGDPAFDFIDWALIDGGNENILTRRVNWLAQEAGVDLDSLYRWCACTAALIAIGRLARGGDYSDDIRSLLSLAADRV